MDLGIHHDNIVNNGFSIIDNIYNTTEVRSLINVINSVNTSNPTFRKTDDLFAIRQFLKEVPAIQQLVFTNKLKNLINDLFGKGFFVVKSIYFDKPEKSNWFVAWHQDLTISVDRKIELNGYGPWTIKQNQFAVQPPLNILEDNFTIRIHLDNTDEGNGALKVIPGSHLKNVYRADSIDWTDETETICCVKAGGVMVMKPLILHSSNRTINNNKRRVIHIEFSKAELPEGIKWAEKMAV